MKSSSIFRIVLLSFSIFLLTSCSKEVNLEYWIPTEEISSYYLMLNDGALRLGAEFKDEYNLFDIISEDKDTIKYKHKLGMFDFTTENGFITEITTASKDVILSSKYFVGMTKNDIVGRFGSPVEIKLKDRYVFLDTVTSTSVEAKFDELTGQSTLLRLSCLKEG